MDAPTILIDQNEILRRVSELAASLRGFCEKDGVTVVWLEKGSASFARDFLANYDFHVPSLGIDVSSYGCSEKSSGKVDVSERIREIKSRRILLLDDIIDTGRTAAAVCRELRKNGANEIMTCFLLDKRERRIENLTPDFVGFEIPDLFVFGYGMDMAGEMRELPAIYCVK